MKQHRSSSLLTVDVDRQSYNGQYSVEDRLRNTCTVTAWFRGHSAVDHFPQAANEPTYVEAPAAKLQHLVCATTM